jgi:hypothetical protein
MALFVQPSLKTVNAYLNLSVKNSVETKLSNHKTRQQKVKENSDIYMGFCTGPQKMKLNMAEDFTLKNVNKVYRNMCNIYVS